MDFDNMSDEELNVLILKQEEKLERYLKCFNEQTERTIDTLIEIEVEIKKRRNRNLQHFMIDS
jgi:hypothetical protein